MKQLILDCLRRWWSIYLLGFLFACAAYSIFALQSSKGSLIAAVYLSFLAIFPCFFAMSAARALMALPGSRRELGTALWLFAVLPPMVVSIVAQAIVACFVTVGLGKFSGGILSAFTVAGTVFLIFVSFVSSRAIGARWTGWRAHGGIAWILLILATVEVRLLDFSSPQVFVPAWTIGLWFTWVGFRHAPELLVSASVKPAKSAAIAWPTFEKFFMPSARRLQGIVHELWSAFRLGFWISLAIHLGVGAWCVYANGWRAFLSKPGILLPFQPGLEPTIALVTIGMGSLFASGQMLRWLMAPRTLRALPLSAQRLAMFWIGLPLAISLGLWFVPVIGYIVWAWQLPAAAFLPAAFCFAALLCFGASLFLHHGLKIDLVVLITMVIGLALSLRFATRLPGLWSGPWIEALKWIEMQRLLLLLGIGTLLMVSAYWLALRGFARRSATYQRPLIPTAPVSPV